MTTLKQAREARLARMNTAQRAEFDAGYAEEQASYAAAEAVWQARQSAGLSQEQLAERLGKKQTYVSALETGKGNPTVATLAKVLAAAGKQISIVPVDAAVAA